MGSSLGKHKSHLSTIANFAPNQWGARTRENTMKGRRRVLIVDDDPEMREMLRTILHTSGFDVIEAADGHSALRMAYQSHPDAILLDIMMADMDGFEVCSRLRELSDVPIIFVTAKSDLNDLVHGFMLGGDDYIVKPFRTPELLCRLEAVLRRAAHRTVPTASAVDAREVPLPIHINHERKELQLGDRAMQLTDRELAIIELLISEPGHVFSAETILETVWGHNSPASINLVKQYILRLRRKLEISPTAPRLLRNVRGGGYYFDPRGFY